MGLRDGINAPSIREWCKKWISEHNKTAEAFKRYLAVELLAWYNGKRRIKYNGGSIELIPIEGEE